MTDKAAILQHLDEVEDPELEISIVELLELSIDLNVSLSKSYLYKFENVLISISLL